MQESNQPFDPNEWYTSSEAVRKLRENSNRQLEATYLSSLAYSGKVDSIDSGSGHKLYRRSQVDAYIVKKRGDKQGHVEYFRKLYGRTRKSRYGITPQQYEAMFVNQMGVCAICGEAPGEGKHLCIDHCHKTGQVRGLLCAPCNFLLGNAQDKIAVLKNAIRYLQRNGA